MIQAFGIPRFGLANGVQTQKKGPQMVRETNERLVELGLTGEDVVTIHVDEEFYHIFYTQKAQPTA